jgi:hypothetical protein
MSNLYRANSAPRFQVYNMDGGEPPAEPTAEGSSTKPRFEAAGPFEAEKKQLSTAAKKEIAFNIGAVQKRSERQAVNSNDNDSNNKSWEYVHFPDIS